MTNNRSEKYKGKSIKRKPNPQLRMAIVVGVLSIIIFIIGSLAINWMVSLIIVGVLDLIYFTYPLFTKKVLDQPKKIEIKKEIIAEEKKKEVKKINHDQEKDMSKKKKEKKKSTDPKKKKKWLKVLMITIAGFFLVGVVAVTGFIILIVTTAPEFNPDNLYMKEASVLYDSKGEVIARLGDEKREIISYDAMPDVLIDALIATEDSRFFQHNGFDLPRFVKATLGQLTGKSGAGGASTITMQIAKNNYTSTVDSGFEGIKRKFTDIYMSIFKIEKKYSKRQILEFYLNSYELGEGAFGVEQASLTYFGKSAKDLNLAEAAMIVGLFNAPTAYNPFNYPEDAEDRRETVLYLMKRHGYITENEYQIAKDMDVKTLLTKDTSSRTPYRGFIDTVVEEVIAQTGKNPYTTPLEIYTTMDRSKQDHINSIFNGEGFAWENETVTAGTAILDINTGGIVAVGTGRNQTGERSYNRATMINRQIGSTAKPLYDYGPGIEFNGWGTTQLFADEPYSYSSGLKIYNWDNGYKGLMTMRDALIGSRNVPALKAFQSTDNAKILKFVKGLGLSPEVSNGMIHEAHALGGYNGESPLSMATAYAAFGNGGYYNEPHSYTKIIYRDTKKEENRNPKHERAMSEATAYMITNMLIDTAKSALYQWANINGAVYGAKTGTSNFSDQTIKDNNLPSNAINDLWVVGTSPDYAYAVWYGYDDINKGYTRFGNRECYKLFQAIGKGIFNSGSNFKPSGDVVTASVEQFTNPAKKPSQFTPSNLTLTGLFKKGTEPTEVSTRFNQLAAPSSPSHNISSNSINLSWKGIDTPDGINSTIINSIYKNIFSSSEYLNNALSERTWYDNSYMGALGYNVYIKKNGQYTLLGYTGNNKFTYAVNSNDPVTFGISSVYSIFKNNESPIIEYTVTVSGINVVKAELTDTKVTVNVGSTINLLDYIRLTENGQAITNKSSYITTSPSTISTAVAGIYDVTYTVNYGNYTNQKFTLKIEVKEP